MSDITTTPKPIIPSRAAAVGAFAGGVTGWLVGIFVGNAVYDAEGKYGAARTGINATGPIMAGSAVAALGAVIGAWLATPSTPIPPTTPAP
jgi:hypothetical protein